MDGWKNIKTNKQVENIMAPPSLWLSSDIET